MKGFNTMKSMLKLFSLAIVSEDKKLGSNDILAYPTEHLAEHEGTLADKEEMKTETKSESNSVTQSVSEKEVTLNAQWVNIGSSNRITAPDVRKGETVLLFKYGSTDRYFWTTFFIENDLRRKEAVLYLFGNEVNFGDMLDKDNSYWFLIDTINKVLQLHTSNNDGETTTYDIKIDTKNGSLQIIDGRGNEIILDSKKDTLTINVPNVKVNSKSVIVNSKETEFKGGHVTFNSTVDFKKSVKCNKNCNTEPKSGEPHAHAVL
jgi:hypothetical protein